MVAVDFEIVVSCQEISQKTDTALIGHQLRAHRKQFGFFCGETPGAALEIAFCEGFKQRQVQLDFGQIRLVLRAGAGAKTDGVTKIVQRKSGHNSIKINDAQRFVRVRVKENIVELGIVVRDPERQRALGEQIDQYRGLFLTLEGEGNLCLRKRYAGWVSL